MNALVNPEQKELDLEDIRFINIKKVIDITGVSKSFIYAMIKEGRFPSPVKYGATVSRWVEHEVRAWQHQQMKARSA